MSIVSDLMLISVGNLRSFSDPPKLVTNVRALAGSRSIDVFLQCSSIANPPSSIVWLDDNEQNIHDEHFYSIKNSNESSLLSFTVFPHSHSKVLYYCRSSNALATVEKLINISGNFHGLSVTRLFINGSRIPSIRCEIQTSNDQRDDSAYVDPTPTEDQ